MLAYYPLEHLYYLRSHDIIPSSVPSPFSLFSRTKRIKLDAGKLGMWSCRFWAFYILLHFAHLMEDKKLLEARQRTLRKGKGTGLNTEEKQDMYQKWDMFCSEVVTNLAYFPFSLHWSLEKGLFKNDAWVNIFGFVAAVMSFRSGWKATSLPPPASEGEKKDKEEVTDTAGYDVVL